MHSKFSAGGKVTGANALIRGYAKSVVGPSHPAAASVCWRLENSKLKGLLVMGRVKSNPRNCAPHAYLSFITRVQSIGVNTALCTDNSCNVRMLWTDIASS